ncbi:hypothetical protein EDB86DRAFT_3085685 [Lactarius hatsudake]|nr:hypothetical protein EDB86DRAFT_3085685 [Lactarius hatsudake]
MPTLQPSREQMRQASISQPTNSPSPRRSASERVDRRMDVEILRPSFGNFAKIATGRRDVAHAHPTFGLIQVAELKDAFERPFRTGTAGDALTATGYLRLRLLPPQPLRPLGLTATEAAAADDGGWLMRTFLLRKQALFPITLHISLLFTLSQAVAFQTARL